MCLLGDEDMPSILMQLIRAFWVIGALIELALALHLKRLPKAVVQVRCVDRDEDEYEGEG